MDHVHTLLVAIIEGITEFLPISSTAHILLYEKISGHDFGELFNVIIQLGAMLAVIVITPKRLLRDRKIQIIVASAVLPTLLIGFIMKGFVKVLQGNLLVIGGSLLLGGLFILAFERWYKLRNAGRSRDRDIGTLSNKEAALVGIAQSIAIIPGISRSAATIYAGLALGLSRIEAVELSFLVGVPTMAAAAGYELLKYRHDFDPAMLGTLGFGTFVSFVVALGAVKLLLRYASRHDFTGFGWYRIVVGAVAIYFALH